MILKRIAAGALNGFPLIRSVVKAIKKESISPVVNEITAGEEKIKKVDYLVLTSEFITSAIIVAYIFKKISFEEVEKILQLLGVN